MKSRQTRRRAAVKRKKLELATLNWWAELFFLPQG